MNYKLRILSSLAAKAYSSGISNGNESSNEYRHSNDGSAFVNEPIRKRDNKAVVKVLYHKG